MDGWMDEGVIVCSYPRYQELAVAGGTDTGTNNNDIRRHGIDADPSMSSSKLSSKPVQSEWTFNIGECALGIQIADHSKHATQIILVLGT
jgi:PTHB1 N-terminus